MRKLPFNLVDVFAEQKYAGNQLAVFRDAAQLSSDEMQKIAQELHFSETTFLLSRGERNGGYDVRIFTPAAEVPFAGHPTLGTAYIIRREIIKKPVAQVILNLQVGQIPVAFERQAAGGDLVWMTPKEASFGETYPAGQIAPLLMLRASDIDENSPIEVVSTGLPFILVPLRSLDAVRRARVDKDQWLDWVKDRPAKMVFIFCRETVHPDHHLHARMFADFYGIPEDPATGSASSCLAAWLVKHRYFGSSEVEVRVEQGYEIGRPSLIYLRGREHAGKIAAKVGGQVILVAEGAFI